MIRPFTATDKFFKSLGPIKFFALTSIFFGLLFIALTPPFQAPDETVHFYRSYQISTLHFVVDQGPNGKAGGVLPKSLSETVILTTTNPSLSFMPASKYNIKKTYHALSIDQNDKKSIFYDFSGTALYPPVTYIPQAVGVGLARILDSPPIIMLYAGRLFNLIAWILIISLSIKLIPFKKWALVFIALIPMAVFQASSLSADVMTIGFVFLFVSYCFYLVKSNKKLTSTNVLLLLTFSIVMVLCKQIMFVFLPLVLLLQNGQFRSPRLAVFTKLLIIIVPLMLLAIWIYIMHGIDVTSTYTNQQNPSSQIKFVLLHPFNFLEVMWNTYFFVWSDTITRSFIGDFGWVDTPLSESITSLGYIGFAFALFANEEASGKFKVWLSNRQKLFIIGLALLYWFAISGALYAYYNPVGFNIIVGLQGRYFFPIAICLVPIFYSSWLKASKRSYQNITIYLPIFLLLASAITIFNRYYITSV